MGNGIHSGVFRFFVITLVLTVFLSFTISDPAYASSRANVRVKNVFGDTRISQDSVQADLYEQGYRAVKLTWKTSGSDSVDKYAIFTSDTKHGRYKKLLVVKDNSAVILLKKKKTFIKVKPYSGGLPGKGSNPIMVRPGKKNATHVTFTAVKDVMANGDSVKFEAHSNGKVTHKVRWSTSDPGIATVSKDGTVTAKANGTFHVIAIAHNGIKKRYEVKVIDKYPAKLKRTSDKEQKMLDGKTLQLSIKATEAMVVKISWYSSNKKIAKVDQNGLVKAVGTGQVKITAKAVGGAKRSYIITVNPNIEEMVKWGEKVANNDKYGYSMSCARGSSGSGKRTLNRYCATCNDCDSRDYDCASFVGACVAHGYKDAAFAEWCGTYDIGGCTDLYYKLLDRGWKDKGNLSEKKLKRGDILINPHAHVEIYYGDGLTVGAHDNYDGKKGDGSGREIRVDEIYAHFWTHVLRK